LRRKTPRAICLDILNEVEGAGRHPDTLLDHSFNRYRHLTPFDRAFITELTYGTLRWRGRLDWGIRQFSKIPFDKIEPGILNILRIGLYQILFLTRTPSSAAVNESAELAKGIRGKGGAGFVNAVLRSILRKGGEASFSKVVEDPLLFLSVTESHPPWLVKRWVDEFGLKEATEICKFNNQISNLTLRTNTLKTSRTILVEKLEDRGLKAVPCPFSEEGFFLDTPPPISEIPFLKKGLFIIQDEASQLVTSIMDPMPGERILDACAAPGGKTTHMAQRMRNEGEVYALDLNQAKLKWIEEMCQRLGIRIVKTIKGDATKPLPVPEGVRFDRILADVPCSGFGTLRKNPDLKWRRGEEDVRRLSFLQSSILGNLSGYVKEGGILVYSTCTVFHEENENVVEKFLERHPAFQLDRMEEVLPGKLQSFIQNGFFKTFPQRNGMDGFFAARMVKVG
jgi:16S rRNA (cytosine967-C5)-methyltransferase